MHKIIRKVIPLLLTSACMYAQTPATTKSSAFDFPFVTINLPLLGPFTLYISTDSETQKSYFKGTLAQNKDLTVGPFKISTGTIILTDDNILSISAPVELFKEKATLFAKIMVPDTKGQQVTIPTINFNLTFDKQPFIQTPELTFAFESGQLIFAQQDGLSFTLLTRVTELDGGSVLISLVAKPQQFELDGTFPTPFIFTPFANIKELSLQAKQVQLKYTQDSIALTISGTAQIFGLPLDANLVIEKVPEGIHAIATCFINKPVAFSQLIPSLKKSVADEIIFNKGIIYITTSAYTDPTSNTLIKPGITLIAQLDVTKESTLAALGEVTNTKSITVTGVLSHNTNDISLVARMPSVEFKNSPVKELAFDVAITGEPLVELSAEATFEPEPHEELAGRLSAGLESSSIVFNGNLNGCWNNPFNILPGLRLCNPTLIVGIEPKTFFTTGIPSKLGFSATFVLTNKIVRMAAVYDAQDNSKMVLIGDFEGTISLQDLLNFTLDLAQKSSATKTDLMKKVHDNVPPIALSDLLFKIAPATMTIYNKTYYRGFTAQGTAELFKQKISMGLNFGYDGIYAQGYFSELKLGPLLITGPGPDGVYGTPDDGALVSMSATLAKQELVIQGQATLTNVFNSQTNINISPLNGITFYTTAKLFNVFSATIDAKSVGSLDNLDFVTTIEFKNELPLMLQNAIDINLKQVQVSLNQIAQEASQHLQDARNALIQQQKQTAADIASAQNSLLQKLNGLNQSIPALQTQISMLEQRITQAKAQIASNPLSLNNVMLGTNIADWETVRATKITQLHLAQAARDATQALITKGASAAGSITTKSLTTGAAAIEDQLKPMVTNILKTIGNITYTGSAFIANNIINALVLTKVSYTGRFSELITGSIGALTIELQVLGSPKRYVIPFNFKDAKTSSQNAANTITKDAFKV